MLKHLIFVIVLSTGIGLFQTPAQAQRRVVNHIPKYDKEPYHFGFIIALNQMNLTYKPIDDYQSIIYNKSNTEYNVPENSTFLIKELTAKPTLGFGVGIVGNLRLNDFFDLRLVPTLSFGERIVEYSPNNMIANDLKPIYLIKKYLPSTSVDIPLYIKFRSKRYNNFAAYLLAGGKYSIEMASNSKIQNLNNTAPIKIDRNDFALDAGVGFDFYTPYFKFGTELKMSYGLKNILIKDNFVYSQVIEQLHNKFFQIAFTFE